jgi:hypothetical protein
MDGKSASARSEVEHLVDQLTHGVVASDKFTASVLRIADALKEAAKAAKVDPIEQFKKAVFGAEGTGPNQMGSSAAGFGQFMPGTWLSYFNRLFPDKADLSEAAKLAYRNVRDVATAVIDKATDDYVAVIKRAGKDLTAANLYAVHLLGAGGASRLFAAAPGTPMSESLRPGRADEKPLPERHRGHGAGGHRQAHRRQLGRGERSHRDDGAHAGGGRQESRRAPAEDPRPLARRAGTAERSHQGRRADAHRISRSQGHPS